MDGKLHVYRREGSPFWQCATYLGGRNHRATTKETQQRYAEEYARDWYAERVVDERRRRRGELTPAEAISAARTLKRRKAKASGPTFRAAAELFMTEFQIITEGERSPIYVDGHRRRLDNHLLPFFGDKPVAAITSADITAYRAHRMKDGLSRRSQAYVLKAQAEDPNAPLDPRLLTKPAKSTLHQEIVCLRGVLNTALNHQWIEHLPNLKKPYGKASKISHRAWFSYDEYKALYTATGQRAANPLKKRWGWASEQLHDFVLFMANTGLRPDEAARLEFRDVKIVAGPRPKEEILLIEVRGKRGIGFCKSTPGAVLPFQRLSERLRPKKVEGDEGAGMGRRSVHQSDSKGLVKPRPTDRLFPNTHRQLFNEVLDELDLKFDRDGQVRTAYSLRHTYICMRLTEGADIYQIAKNCRTSVEMIEKFYASHLANTLDAEAINVRNRRARRDVASPKRSARNASQHAEMAQ